MFWLLQLVLSLAAASDGSGSDAGEDTENNRTRRGPRGLGRPAPADEVRRGNVEWVYRTDHPHRSLYGAVSIKPDEYRRGECNPPRSVSPISGNPRARSSRSIYAFPRAQQGCTLWDLSVGEAVNFKVIHRPRDSTNPEDFRVEAVDVTPISGQQRGRTAQRDYHGSRWSEQEWRDWQRDWRPSTDHGRQQQESSGQADSPGLNTRLQNAYLRGQLAQMGDEISCYRWGTPYNNMTYNPAQPSPTATGEPSSSEAPPWLNPQAAAWASSSTEFEPLRTQPRPEWRPARASTPWPREADSQRLRERIKEVIRGQSREPGAASSSHDGQTQATIARGEQVVGMLAQTLSQMVDNAETSAAQRQTTDGDNNQVHGGVTVEEIPDDEPEQD